MNKHFPYEGILIGATMNLIQFFFALPDVSIFTCEKGFHGSSLCSGVSSCSVARCAYSGKSLINKTPELLCADDKHFDLTSVSIRLLTLPPPETSGSVTINQEPLTSTNGILTNDDV